MNQITAMKKVSKRLIEKKRISGAEQYKFPVNMEYKLPTFVEYGLPENDINGVVDNARKAMELVIFDKVKAFNWVSNVNLVAGGKTLVVSTDLPALTGENSGVDLISRATDLDAIGDIINTITSDAADSLSSKDNWQVLIRRIIADNEDTIKSIHEQNKALTKMLD